MDSVIAALWRNSMSGPIFSEFLSSRTEGCAPKLAYSGSKAPCSPRRSFSVVTGATPTFWEGFTLPSFDGVLETRDRLVFFGEERAVLLR